jgi:hypothetical protein
MPFAFELLRQMYLVLACFIPSNGAKVSELSGGYTKTASDVGITHTLLTKIVSSVEKRLVALGGRVVTTRAPRIAT